MKFSWGTGIGFFYGAFAAGMIFFVIKTTTYDNSLVVDDYYAKDLAYQEQYDKEKNSLAPENRVKVTLDKKKSELTIRFPEIASQPKGTIQFYNPVSKSYDFTVNINAGEKNLQVISLEDAHRGRWKVKIDWESDDKKFYEEKTIMLR